MMRTRIECGPRVRRASAVAGAVLMVVGLAACGGGGGTDPTPVTPPAPQTFTQNLTPFTFNGLQPGQIASVDITITGTGTMRSDVNWTFSSNDLDIYVTSTSCNATNINNLQSGCSAIGRTTSVITKPESLTVNVSTGSYRIWVAHFGSSSESGTLTVSATGTR